MNDEAIENPSGNEIVIYEAEDGVTKLSVSFDGDTVWLTQAQMAELFQRDISTISRHIANVFEDGELEEESNLQKMQIASSDKPIMLYSLDVIISVGYRVKSVAGVHFRKWATGILREYLIKGFSINDERLKEGDGRYWDELLARIRDIRSSEKMLYRQVLDLYATAVDYDPKSGESVRFFKIVQNKLHYGAHGHTAAEVIWERADADKPFMGLTTFKGDQVTKQDIGIAKNYLSEEELTQLNLLVSGYFDIAELRAQRHIPTYMQDYIEQLDGVLEITDASVLDGAGKVSHKQAMDKAEREYRAYQKKALSPVEASYLESIKAIEKDVSKRKRL